MRIMMMAGATLLVAAATLPLASRGLDAQAAPSAATIDVSADDNFFAPSSLTIDVGDTVHWTNDGAIIHTVDDDGALFSSGVMQVGDEFSFTYNSPGTFPYTCIVHSGMTGTITVQQQATTTATTAAGTATPTRTRTATPSPSPTGSATATATVVGTVTPLPTLTPVTPPAPVAPTTTPSGGAGPLIVAPNTGGGASGGGGGTDGAALALGVLGAAMLASGALARRVRE